MNITFKKGDLCLFCNTIQTQEGISCEKCNKAPVQPQKSFAEKIGTGIVMSAARMICAVKDEPGKERVDEKSIEIFSSSIIKLPGIIALGALLYSLIHLLQNPAKPFLDPEFFIFSNMGAEVAVVSFAGAVFFFLLRNQTLIRMIFSAGIAILIIIRPLFYLVNNPGDLESFVQLYLHSDNIEFLIWGAGFFLISIFVDKKLKRTK